MSCTDDVNLSYIVCDPAPYPPVYEANEDEESKNSSASQSEFREPSILDLEQKPAVIIRYG